jgi:hypothetical protein
MHRLLTEHSAPLAAAKRVCNAAVSLHSPATSSNEKTSNPCLPQQPCVHAVARHHKCRPPAPSKTAPGRVQGPAAAVEEASLAVLCVYTSLHSRTKASRRVRVQLGHVLQQRLLCWELIVRPSAGPPVLCWYPLGAQAAGQLSNCLCSSGAHLQQAHGQSDTRGTNSQPMIKLTPYMHTECRAWGSTWCVEQHVSLLCSQPVMLSVPCCRASRLSPGPWHVCWVTAAA